MSSPCGATELNLWSARTQVQSLAWHSGLRILCCCHCGIGSNGSLHLIPGLGTPCAMGQAGKKKKSQLLQFKRLVVNIWEYPERAGPPFSEAPSPLKLSCLPGCKPLITPQTHHSFLSHLHQGRAAVYRGPCPVVILK